jgi:hypothetical protein
LSFHLDAFDFEVLAGAGEDFLEGADALDAYAGEGVGDEAVCSSGAIPGGAMVTRRQTGLAIWAMVATRCSREDLGGVFCFLHSNRKICSRLTVTSLGVTALCLVTGRAALLLSSP